MKSASNSRGCLLGILLILTPWLLIPVGCSLFGRLPAIPAVHAPSGAPLEAPAPTSTADADTKLKAARAERDDLAARLDAEDSTINRLNAERDKLHEQDIQRRLAWFSGIILIGVLAAVGLWFVLPAGLKSWAVYLGLGCIAISAAALGLRALVPYREVIGLGLLAAGAAFGLWKLGRFKVAGAQTARAFDSLENAFVGMKAIVPEADHQLIDEAIAKVKHNAALDQGAAGVRKVIAAIRGKDPKAPTALPVSP